MISLIGDSFTRGNNGRVIFSIRLDTQKKSTEMIDALGRLLVDSSVVTPTGHIFRTFNIYGYYARWRDERSPPQCPFSQQHQIHPRPNCRTLSLPTSLQPICYLPPARGPSSQIHHSFPFSNLRIVNNQMKQYILAKKKSHSQNLPTGKPKDILDLALSDPDYGSSTSTSELIDQLKTFFFAGHDTTASTISWAYYFLSQSPSSLLLLRQELDTVFGSESTPGEVASKLMSDPKIHNRLDYTLAVIKESLRLEPPAAPAREIPP